MDYMPSPDDYLKSIGDTTPLGPQSPRPKRHWLRNFLLLVGLVVVGVVAYLLYTLTTLSANPLDFGALSGDGGRTNILILGIGDPGHAGEKLSDTMMVMSLDTQGQRVALISIPRDLRVNIPGYGYGKINEANALGGPQLAEQVVSNTLGIPIHYYMQTNFTGLKQAVDAVGGIDITVKTELRDPEYPCSTNENASCGLDIKPGQYHMNGAVALEYARCRKGTCGNDFGRALRQQEVVKAVETKALDPWLILHPVRLNHLAAAFRDNIRTDLSTNDLLTVFDVLHKSPAPVDVVFSTSPGGLLGGVAGSSDLLPIGGSYAPLQEAAQNVFTANPPPQPNQ